MCKSSKKQPSLITDFILSSKYFIIVLISSSNEFLYAIWIELGFHHSTLHGLYQSKLTFYDMVKTRFIMINNALIINIFTIHESLL